MKHKILFGVLALFVLVASCKKDPEITDGKSGIDTIQLADMTPYELIRPTFFPAPEPIPENNQLFVERIALGKKLFFDTRLSNNGENCESCHKQNLGFSMVGTSAFDNGHTSLPLINLAWNKNFMWSGRITGTLEDVMFFEVTERFNTDMNKINDVDEYRVMFKSYYGVDEIKETDLARALAQYMRTLISRNTLYDMDIRGDKRMSQFAKAGMNLFFNEKADCWHCHVQSFLSNNSLHNTGLDNGTYTKDIDKGYYNVSGDPKDLGMFIVPNLRNVALRTHYMHDGRYTTLEQVVDFYSDSVKTNSNIDPVMHKDGRVDGKLNLTDIEKKQLVEFLKTLTDSVMITNDEFKAP